MSEAEFVGRIVARLQSAPTLSRNISQLGSNDVPRPAGLPSLGKVLRRHPSLFATSADTVSLVVGAVEAEYVARLVAHLHGRDLALMGPLGNQVPRPDSVPGPLGRILRRHPSLFDVHRVGSSDAVSLASGAESPAQPAVPRPAPPAPQPAQRTPEAEYVAALVAYLQGKPHVLLPPLGTAVPKPAAVHVTLGKVLRRHPNLFTVHRVGNSDAVSRMPGAVPPPVPAQQRGQQVDPSQVAKLFWQYLSSDPDLRARCTSKTAFGEEFRSWRMRQPQAVTGCAPGTVLHHLNKQGLIQPAGADTINFATSRAAAAAKKVTENREKLEEDKGDVTVSRADFGTVRLGESVTQELAVRNAGAELCWMRSIMLERGHTGFTAELAHAVPFALQPGTSTTVTIRARPVASGMARDLFTLGFESESAGRFTIGRFLEARCGDADLLSDLKPESPYQKRKKRPRRTDGEKLQEEPPPKEQPRQGGESGGEPAAKGPKLGAYEIPQAWREALEQEDLVEAAEKLEDGQQKLENAPPTEALAEYADFFHLLLWAEERQLKLDLTAFDLVEEKATTMHVRGSEHILHVRGLAEKRPSVLRGDQVRANMPGERSRVWRGRAGQIEMEDVHLRFAPNFPYVAGQKVEICFQLGRTPLRLFHQGLDLVRHLRPSVLFPEPLRTDQLAEPRLDTSSLRWFNPNVRDNPQQSVAVRAVVGGEGRRIPYIIFGPPGTGKTTTLVEAVLQCVRGDLKPPLRVLVAAPTNTAADWLCLQLSAVISDPMQMLRLMAYSRAKSEVSAELLRFCRWDDSERAFAMPELADIQSKRVVVSTLSMAAKLHNQGLARGHFDMIVVDESGQALEPEAVASAAALLGENTQLLLAGDPKQLGPVIHNGLAKANGLSTSLLERLMRRDAYQRQGEGLRLARRVPVLRLALAVEAPPSVRPSGWPQGEARRFTFFHGTSWENALRIDSRGFEPSGDGCLGAGVYVGRAEKAIGFAQSGERHGGESGGLVQAEVTICNPKFVSYEDRQWEAEGYDACRTEQTRFSNSMEWCIASPSQLRVVRITQIPLVQGAHDAPPPGEDAAPPPAGFDERVMTKLLRNFRSHAELVRLPNRLFYDNELLACADPILANSCLGWEKLPNPKFPLIFHGIEGKDQREGNSPSWFNADEALLVLSYVKDLLELRPSRCEQHEIGVITPYNKQMQKLQRMLRGAQLDGVKVGSTELFQGQERRVMIISTVRSSEDFLGFDRKHNLGFLDNPKRFNVAITRAKSLLIVIGNPAVLKHDEHWGSLLRLAVENGAYAGVPVPPDAPDGGGADGDALAERLEQMVIGTEDASEQLLQEHMEMPDFGV